MLYRFWRKVRRTWRNWNYDPTRADRNAVIQRVVAAAALETKDKTSAPLGQAIDRKPTPPPLPAPFSDDAELSKDAIGKRAYEIWVRNGRPSGTTESDWRQAVTELRAEKSAPASP
jgi:hypothetical protein